MLCTAYAINRAWTSRQLSVSLSVDSKHDLLIVLSLSAISHQLTVYLILPVYHLSSNYATPCHSTYHDLFFSCAAFVRPAASKSADVIMNTEAEFKCCTSDANHQGKQLRGHCLVLNQGGPKRKGHVPMHAEAAGHSDEANSSIK